MGGARAWLERRLNQRSSSQSPQNRANLGTRQRWAEPSSNSRGMGDVGRERGPQRESRGKAWARPGLEPRGADVSPRHSVARGLARKPGPHTQRKLPGVFSQRPGVQSGGTRRHSSTSKDTEGAGHQLTRQSSLSRPASVQLTEAAGALRAEPEAGVTSTSVAIWPRYAASWTANLGVALTHARGGT